ncbi:MAG: iron-sulfur cluster assembly scaffold protein [Deltaproteobacteria bacterium HGW-Deltaproteobacteria-15]|nr:MAG: iron-sulfur cluster assembly scaffold protein [Deltaproteobacteria bacterium HGW-Deltaproteobacteria-15]
MHKNSCGGTPMNEDKDEVAGINEGTSAACKPEECEKWLNPLYRAFLDTPGGYSASACSGGDGICIFLRFEGDKVEQANFQTTGCTACSLCCFFAVKLALGKSSDELGKITGEGIMEFMGGLPEKDRHCAFLASEALGKVLRKYRMKQLPKGTILRKPCLALVKPAKEQHERI